MRAKVRRVAITTDFWTSVAQDAYLSVTAHYISPEWELKSAVLETRNVTERHTMDNVSDNLKAVAVEWQIDQKLSGATTDNACNMVRAVQFLSWKHIPCFGHTLQLAVKAGLEIPSVIAVLARCRNIVGHFKKGMGLRLHSELGFEGCGFLLNER